jgi:hypothetical protein
VRSARRTPKKQKSTVADLLRARMERERKLCAKVPAPPLTEKLNSIVAAAARLGLSVWTLRHWSCTGQLNYRRIGRRMFVSESEIARLAGNEVQAVNVAA